MSGISQINYSDALAGRIDRQRSIDPIGAWFVAMGATYKSSQFVDAELRLGDDHLENLLMIIRSARKQGHEGVEIRLTKESRAVVQSFWADMAALEDADFRLDFYGEFLGRERAIVTFRPQNNGRLLDAAKKELSEHEYIELHRLVTTRMKRSEREVQLTKKAIEARIARMRADGRLG
jgi:hypothetical protein